MHVGEPSLGVYVPAPHGSGFTLPTPHSLPAQQASHSEVLTRLVAFDHVPGGQAVAIELPVGHA